MVDQRADGDGTKASDVLLLNTKGLECAWRPAWAMEWDVFTGRYGRFGAMSQGWKQIVPIPSWREDERTSRSGNWKGIANPELSKMVGALEMSLISIQSPWMMPKHISRKVDAGEKQRPRLLFQYKPYENQERLTLSDNELAGSIDAVFSQESSPLHEARDAGLVILIKIIIDAYLEKGPEIAFQQVLSLLKKPLSEGRVPQCAVFDVITNLMIHGELLYSTQAEENDNHLSGDWRSEDLRHSTVRFHAQVSLEIAPWPPICEGEFVQTVDVRVEQFREWLRRLLFQLTSHLESIESQGYEDSGSEVWACVFACMASLCTHDGYFVLEYMQHAPLRPLCRMLHVGRHAFWATRICSLLKSILCNLLYRKQSSEDGIDKGVLDFEKIEECGGIQQIVKEYYHAPTLMSTQSLFCVLFDFVLNAKSTDGDVSLSPGNTWGFSMHETSEVQIVGNALLHMRAANALRDYLVLPPMDSDAVVNKNLARVVHTEIMTQLHSGGFENSLQERVPLSFVEYCITSLKDVTSKLHCIPDALNAYVTSTCDAGIFGESESENWRFLENALLSESPRDQVVGRSWLVKLMVSASDREIEEAWISRKNVIPPPVPLMPSNTPDRDLFTCGDTILSALAKSKSKIHGQGYLLTYRRFEGDDFVVTNFALSIRQVVSAMRFRMLDLPGDLHTRWNNGAVDTKRLCISTIERAFEWIFGFSSAPEWSTAITLLAECLISTIATCDVPLPPSPDEDSTLSGHVTEDEALISRPTSAVPETPSASRPLEHQDFPAEKVAPLRIPSPSSENGGDMLSPLSKLMPGAPKLAAAWRRLRTPGSSKNRPNSAETANPEDDFSVNRPLSAGVMKMDSTRSRSSCAESIFVRDSITQFPTSGYNQTVPKSWRSLSEKVVHMKEKHAKAHLDKYRDVCSTVRAFEQTLDPVESFIMGISSCPVHVIEMVNPQILKDIFDAMNQVDIDGVKLLESSSRQAAVQAGKPFWDSRLAIFLLLVDSFRLTEKNQYNHPLLKSSGYLHALLRDPDDRVRHHVCSFILSRFCQQDRMGYVNALATIVSRAQKSNDDRLIRDPETQVNKMLEMRLFDMSTIMLES